MSANDELQAHTCEKMLQEYGNVANNVAQRNSQDLTEQYQKGTLKNDFYYFDNGKTQYIVEYHNLKGIEGLEGVEVLERVPSYEKWKSLKLHDEKATIKLGEKIIENDKLKELLIECWKEIKTLWDKALYDNGDRMPYSDRFVRLDKLKTKIDEVLK